MGADDTPKNRDVSKKENEYVPPRIVSYHCDELLEKLGPARACVSAPTCPTADVVGA